MKLSAPFLVPALLAALVVGVFEGTIARITMLAVFLPVVAGQGGNTGAQALVVVVRALALGEVRSKAWRVLAREFLLGAASGIVVGITAAAAAFLVLGDPRFGFVPSHSRYGINSEFERYGTNNEFEVPDEAFMAIELVPGALDGVQGTMKFQPEFRECM